MADTTPSNRHVPPLQPAYGVFVDLDGTLLALRDDPAAIRADAALRALLRGCSNSVGGALAIVSGRPLAVLDACLAPERFPAAGLHGLERRNFSGATNRLTADRSALRRVARDLAQAMEELPLTQLEDKGDTLALHWRRAPEHAAALQRLAAAALARLGTSFSLLEGNCVVELLPRVASKGSAVRAFMREQPFRGRLPVFVGDDLTDLAGFEAAREFGGFGIAVGTRIDGDFRLPDVNAVHAWLAGGSNG